MPAVKRGVADGLEGAEGALEAAPEGRGLGVEAGVGVVVEVVVVVFLFVVVVAAAALLSFLLLLPLLLPSPPPGLPPGRARGEHVRGLGELQGQRGGLSRDARGGDSQLRDGGGGNAAAVAAAFLPLTFLRFLFSLSSSFGSEPGDEQRHRPRPRKAVASAQRALEHDPGL